MYKVVWRGSIEELQREIDRLRAQGYKLVGGDSAYANLILVNYLQAVVEKDAEEDDE